MSIDLNNIQTQIKLILDTANTTTATNNLSDSMSDKVRNVFKLNPMKLPIQASQYPFVSVSIDGKSIEQINLGIGSANVQREASVDVNIIGGVYEDNFGAITEDPATTEIQLLMENIEEILRNNVTVNNTASWSGPNDVRYDTLQLEEGAHVRASLMVFRMKIFY